MPLLPSSAEKNPPLNNHQPLSLKLGRFALNAVVHLIKRILLEHRTVWTETACSSDFLFSLASGTEHVAGKVRFFIRWAGWAQAEFSVFFVVWNFVTQNVTNS